MMTPGTPAHGEKGGAALCAASSAHTRQPPPITEIAALCAAIFTPPPPPSGSPPPSPSPSSSTARWVCSVDLRLAAKTLAAASVGTVQTISPVSHAAVYDGINITAMRVQATASMVIGKTHGSQVTGNPSKRRAAAVVGGRPGPSL